MLFWLEGDLARVSEVMATEENRSAFNNLLDSAIAGDHVLYGARSYLAALVQGGFVEGRGRDFINWISQRLTQDGRAIESLPKVRVSADYCESSIVGGEWNIPLFFLASRDALRVPFLLAENIRDSRMYIKFANAWLEEKLSSYILRMTPVHGGGDTTGEVFSVYIKDGFPAVYCVVDSDKKHSEDSLGQTAKGCKAALRNQSGWHHRLDVLHSRELENIMPSSLRESVLSGMSRDHYDSHLLLCSLPEEVMIYLCLKQGDSLCRFYMKGDLKAYDADVNSLVCVSCGKGEACGSVSGFGNKLLARILEKLDSGVKIPICSEWNSRLESMIGEMAIFGLGSAPHRLLG